MRPLTLVPLLLFLACGEDRPAAGTPDEATEAQRPADRDAWWTGATMRASGSERVLAPREWRVLLASGRKFGFAADAAWWEPKSKLAYERILALDSEDLEANSAVGRKTLQSIPGFGELWTRILEARVQNPAMDQLLDQYGIWIEEERPIFLTEDDYQIAFSKIRSARGHLDRMESDKEYAALQIALERVPSQLRDYPSVRARAGPFLLFLASPDLRRIEGESDKAEDERLGALRTRYEKQLAERAKVLEALVADLQKLYPELAKRHPIAADSFFFIWIFADPGWYSDFLDAIRREQPANRYRCGFFNAKDMWGYLFVPRAPEVAPPKHGEETANDEPDPESRVRETLAYIGAKQLMRHWARDPKDRFSNRLDKSRAYWLKEGWPGYMAARRVAKPSVGPTLKEGWRFGRVFPALQDIIERESRLELARFVEAAPETEEDAQEMVQNFGLRRYFVDLAWLVTQQLNEADRRKAFEQYLISQIEAARKGNAESFAEAFGLKDEGDWATLEDAVYDSLEGS